MTKVSPMESLDAPATEKNQPSPVPQSTGDEAGGPPVVTPTQRPSEEKLLRTSSVKYIQHKDVRSQAMGRKVELEELRQKQLAKKLGKEYSHGEAVPFSTSELTDFFLKQKEMEKNLRKKQIDSKEYLHSYRNTAADSPRNARTKSSPKSSPVSAYTTMSEFDHFFLRQKAAEKERRDKYKDSMDHLHRYKGSSLEELEALRNSESVLVSSSQNVEQSPCSPQQESSSPTESYAHAFADMKNYMQKRLAEAMLCRLPESPQQSPFISGKLPTSPKTERFPAPPIFDPKQGQQPPGTESCPLSKAVICPLPETPLCGNVISDEESESEVEAASPDLPPLPELVDIQSKEQDHMDMKEEEEDQMAEPLQVATVEPEVEEEEHELPEAPKEEAPEKQSENDNVESPEAPEEEAPEEQPDNDNVESPEEIPEEQPEQSHVESPDTPGIEPQEKQSESHDAEESPLSPKLEAPEQQSEDVDDVTEAPEIEAPEEHPEGDHNESLESPKLEALEEQPPIDDVESPETPEIEAQEEQPESDDAESPEAPILEAPEQQPEDDDDLAEVRKLEATEELPEDDHIESSGAPKLEATEEQQPIQDFESPEARNEEAPEEQPENVDVESSEAPMLKAPKDEQPQIENDVESPEAPKEQLDSNGVESQEALKLETPENQPPIVGVESSEAPKEQPDVNDAESPESLTTEGPEEQPEDDNIESPEAPKSEEREEEELREADVSKDTIQSVSQNDQDIMLAKTSENDAPTGPTQSADEHAEAATEGETEKQDVETTVSVSEAMQQNQIPVEATVAENSCAPNAVSDSNAATARAEDNNPVETQSVLVPSPEDNKESPSVEPHDAAAAIVAVQSEQKTRSNDARTATATMETGNSAEFSSSGGEERQQVEIRANETTEHPHPEVIVEKKPLVMQSSEKPDQAATALANAKSPKSKSTSKAVKSRKAGRTAGVRQKTKSKKEVPCGQKASNSSATPTRSTTARMPRKSPVDRTTAVRTSRSVASTGGTGISPSKRRTNSHRHTAPPIVRFPYVRKTKPDRTYKRPVRDELSLICTSKWIPDVHSSRGGCERCLHFASQEETDKFKAMGHHYRVSMVRGGCARSCSYFPRKEDEPPVRLCPKCFYDTHVGSRKDPPQSISRKNMR